MSDAISAFFENHRYRAVVFELFWNVAHLERLILTVAHLKLLHLTYNFAFTSGT